MKNKYTFAAWFLLLIAMAAWACVGLFAWVITSDEADRELRIQTLQDTQNKDASATRLHAVAQDTEQKRMQLGAVLHGDVVSVVDLIEAVGKAAGVKLAVSNAQPENSPAAQMAGGPKIVATGFVVEAQGKFSSLMRVVELLQNLPIPSTLGRFDIERVSSTAPGVADTWHMNASIHVLTASETSS